MSLAVWHHSQSCLAGVKFVCSIIKQKAGSICCQTCWFWFMTTHHESENVISLVCLRVRQYIWCQWQNKWQFSDDFIASLNSLKKSNLGSLCISFWQEYVPISPNTHLLLASKQTETCSFQFFLFTWEAKLFSGTTFFSNWTPWIVYQIQDCARFNINRTSQWGLFLKQEKS